MEMETLRKLLEKMIDWILGLMDEWRDSLLAMSSKDYWEFFQEVIC
jgi:hypothetical protein